MSTAKFLLVAGTVVAAVASAPAAPVLSLTPVGTLKTGPFRDADPRVAEINAFDPTGQRIYVVNPLDGRVDIIDASTPESPSAQGSLDLVGDCTAALGLSCPLTLGLEPNSVAIHGDLLAIAAANAVRTNNGHAIFYRLQGAALPAFVAAVEAGALPDMVTFSEDGRYALTANEGEPNSSYTIDPLGTVSIIDTTRLGLPGSVRHVDFTRFEAPGQRRKLEKEGVRIFGPGASLSQDLEPEYIAVRGNTAYVTLQENNALAIINIDDASVEKIVGLGLKDHSLEANKLDPSDRDGGIRIGKWPLFGMYQPDAVATFSVDGRTYLITANEGDAREYGGLVEAIRLGNANYVLDPSVFPNAADLKSVAALGRIEVSKSSGDSDGDGLFERIDTFGARSVSIRDQQGRLVWDSGDAIERIVEAQHLAGKTVFHASNNATEFESRSDAKGAEPESVVVGDVGGRTYAFIGLERDGGIVVLDLSNPAAPAFVAYANNRKFPKKADGTFASCADSAATPGVSTCGDLGPEGLTFVPAAKSPTGKALLIVSNEVSSTTTTWQVE